MRTFVFTSAGTLVAFALCAACTVSTGNEKQIFTNPGSAGASGAGSGGTDSSGGSGGGITIDAGNTGGSGATPSKCTSGPDDDQDQDGWSKTQGDCHDCDARVNPGAIDVLNSETSAWATRIATARRAAPHKPPATTAWRSTQRTR